MTNTQRRLIEMMARDQMESDKGKRIACALERIADVLEQQHDITKVMALDHPTFENYGELYARQAKATEHAAEGEGPKT